MHSPNLDGSTHINIYSKASTELGRFLTNFALSSITIEDGNFKSIEGYWYWLGTHNEQLRTLYGFKAKQFGKSLTRVIKLTEDVFRKKIQEACWIKLHSSQKYLTLFKNSSLPFTHYYVFGTKVHDAGYEWLIYMWEYYRTYIKNGYKF